MTPEDRSKIQERKNMAAQNLFYSVQRIDLLIISVSGAGIYVCLETLKFILENKEVFEPLNIKVAGGFFLGAIILNFISQLTGKAANSLDFLMSEAELEGKDVEAAKYDGKASSYDEATSWFTGFSMLAMFVGLTFLFAFFLRIA